MAAPRIGLEGKTVAQCLNCIRWTRCSCMVLRVGAAPCHYLRIPNHVCEKSEGRIFRIPATVGFIPEENLFRNIAIVRGVCIPPIWFCPHVEEKAPAPFCLAVDVDSNFPFLSEKCVGLFNILPP